MSMDELANVKGRGWEDIDVSSMLRGLLLEGRKLIMIIALNSSIVEKTFNLEQDVFLICAVILLL